MICSDALMRKSYHMKIFDADAVILEHGFIDPLVCSDARMSWSQYIEIVNANDVILIRTYGFILIPQI